MKCPICKSKLYCFYSLYEGDGNQFRKLACHKCMNTYVSYEKLVKGIYKEDIPNYLKKKKGD